MENNHKNNRLISLNLLNKDRQNVSQFIRKQVEKQTGKSFEQIKEDFGELRRYNMALRCVTTTNKAVCEAMQIPVEAGTRYKARLERLGVLVASTDKFICPFTKESGVQLLSTNPKEFDRLRKTNDSQLKLFPNE